MPDVLVFHAFGSDTRVKAHKSLIFLFIGGRTMLCDLNLSPVGGFNWRRIVLRQSKRIWFLLCKAGAGLRTYCVLFGLKSAGRKYWSRRVIWLLFALFFSSRCSASNILHF